MAGLLNLNNLGGNTALQAGLGILANNTGHYGAFAPAFGRGAMQGMQQAQGFRQDQAHEEFRKQQMEMQKAAQARQIEQDTARQQANQDVSSKFSIDPNLLMAYPDIGKSLLERQLIPKDPELLIAPNGQAINKNDPTNLGQNFAPTPEIDYNKPFLPDGTPNLAYQKFKLSDSKSGASNTNIKIDTKVGEGLAKEVGPMVAASKAAAEGANNTFDITNQLDNAINSGKLISGPFADSRVKLLQIGQVLGVNGTDEEETLANTRGAIQGLSKITLEGRSALKGQGQISDYEGKLLARASSGEIGDLTIPELKVISKVAKRVATAQQEMHSRNMKVMRTKPELSDVADFYDVPIKDSGSGSILPSGETMPPPKGAINMLKMNPSKYRDDFDAKYGAGASQRVLGK